MTNQNTNVVPAKSFGTDWSTVWSTTVATDYIVKKRIWLVLIMLIFAYVVGCILHAIGYGLINIIIGSVAMMLVLVNATRPLTVTIFGLGGVAYAAADKVVDLGPGVKAGLENLVRLANAVMMFIGLTFLLLGTWPLAVPVWMYALVPMGTALLVNILIYEKMASKGWVWKLFGTYIIVLFVAGALGGIPIINSIFGWANVQQESIAAKIDESVGKEKPLKAEDQTARLDRIAQDGDAAAAQQAAAAEASAKATETERLVKEVTVNLPTFVSVPRCSENKVWSDAISIPSDWSVKAAWGGKHVLIWILKDGEWGRQMTLKVDGEIAAVKYCTTSTALLEQNGGKMGLTWTAKN